MQDLSQLVGMEISRAVMILQRENIPCEITNYDDKKMNNSDCVLVLRARQEGEVVQLVATKFLFSQANN